MNLIALSLAIVALILFVLWHFYPQLFCKCENYTAIYVPPKKKLIIRQGARQIIKSKSNITNN